MERVEAGRRLRGCYRECAQAVWLDQGGDRGDARQWSDAGRVLRMEPACLPVDG